VPAGAAVWSIGRLNKMSGTPVLRKNAEKIDEKSRITREE
tara:strand:+ start:1096 stop:1215 length:120 start_codon:yes stop_codon:yes gene_type:complete